MWNRCEILPAWWAEMWPQICILESGGHKGWWISRIWNLFSFCLCHHLFCLTQLNLLLGESISRKKILNLFTTSKEFELRDFEGYCWLMIRLCGKWKLFSGRREESSDPCCEDKFANVIYTIRLWRWPTRKNILEIFFANVWDEIRWNSYWVPLPDDQPFIWSTTFFPLSWSMSVF